MARILIVDDDPNVLELVRELLSMQGHTPDLAADGAEALSKMRQARYDLLIIDYHMPVMDGLQTLAALAGEPALRPKTVLMFTSVADPMVLAKATQAGADGCLHKPVQLAQFSAAVRQALGPG
ncbi:MAG: response regulator [Elusimicrobiota bacterium]